ncbi:hypothetical protein CKY39_20550 [Variovorax boronicumulans]|uniref:Phage tail protein n=1 Tax=Variovorax boronicumulans TaxID=436515 RepID=A0A250DLY1_9BURK|nr:hypothetical protein [Variovorax boronicumulans]ATA55340.1 hypothetical protein CKY39_20550 [Variovorax boronicumulans]
MASPVDTSVKYVLSTMANAPTSNGASGSFIALLEAFLVTGWDTKALTSLVVAGGIATATWTGSHSALEHAVILVQGVTDKTALNGEQKVTGKQPNTLTFACPGVPDGAAAGSISIKMAPAGWSKPFSVAGRAVFKSAAVDALGGGMCLRVDDAGTTAARVVAYESMSDVDTGLGPFPAPAQMSGGGYWTKSTVASATPAAYAMFADARFFFWHPIPAFGANATFMNGTTRGFGDLLSRRASGDPFAVALNYSVAPAPASQYDGSFDNNRAVSQTATPRDFTGLGSAVLNTIKPYVGTQGNSGSDTTFGEFPSRYSGELFMSREFIVPGGALPPRADIPGIRTIPQSKVADSLRFGDRVPGTADLAGRTLLVVNPSISGFAAPTDAASAGVTLFDITGPWR